MFGILCPGCPDEIFPLSYSIKATVNKQEPRDGHLETHIHGLTSLCISIFGLLSILSTRGHAVHVHQSLRYHPVIGHDHQGAQLKGDPLLGNYPLTC